MYYFLVLVVAGEYLGQRLVDGVALFHGDVEDLPVFKVTSSDANESSRVDVVNVLN
ncbi:hypothetical protein [Micromonospora craniellae]|uniref:hypothetical protein n=1 Tax=Micromonospora craniellae TaxID=2294034 RepID=UPI00168B0237|nr:hypothetical protein [Micromonospora craniellae]QOC94128.1 hypothetical protein ID554_11265 [Micromonospora craniellae]